jgi:hypothetical protein
MPGRSLNPATPWTVNGRLLKIACPRLIGMRPVMAAA